MSYSIEVNNSNTPECGLVQIKFNEHCVKINIPTSQLEN